MLNMLKLWKRLESVEECHKSYAASRSGTAAPRDSLILSAVSVAFSLVKPDVADFAKF